MKKSLLLLGISLLLTSCIPPKAETAPIVNKMPEVAQQEIQQDTLPEVPTTSYTAAEVSMHTTKDDCWLIIDDGVYDVTSFIPRHPGGDMILRGCGKDATKMFAQHPQSAEALKEQFKIGELAK